MDASAYAFAHGVRQRARRCACGSARRSRWWLAGSPARLWPRRACSARCCVVASLDNGYQQVLSLQPPFAVGDLADVAHILGSNLLVLALHAMACVAGFIAGSSLPLQAPRHRGLSRWVHEHGGRLAIAFVVGATAFSLSVQAYVIGHTLAGISHFLRVSPALLLLGVLPHAIPELISLFLPLAAWIIASRRGEWDQLLAATSRDGRAGGAGARARGVPRGLRLTAPVHGADPHQPADSASLRRLDRQGRLTGSGSSFSIASSSSRSSAVSCASARSSHHTNTAAKLTEPTIVTYRWRRRAGAHRAQR